MLHWIRRQFGQLAAMMRQLVYVPRGLAIVWTATRSWNVAWVCLIVLAGLLPPATITLTKLLVDDIIRAVHMNGSWVAVRPLLIVAGLMAAAGILHEILQGALEWVRAGQSQLIQDHISDLIQKKSLEVDFAFYESPDYYDRLYRARDDGQNRILNFLEHLGNVVQNVITLLVLMLIVAVYNPLLVAAMFVSVLPAFYVVARAQFLTHEWWTGTTVERRWIQYYDQKFTTSAAAAEMRLFGLGPYFQGAYQQLRRVLRESYLGLIHKQNKARVLAALSGAVIASCAVAYVGWRTVSGQASIGDLALFYQAFAGGQAFMRVITVSLAQVYSNSLFLKNLCEFLEMKPTITDPPNPVPAPCALERGIAFRDVTFRYPGSERFALTGLNLFIPAGKIVAIVGPNGAGKSTLVKLLSRFYDPASGTIALDGIRLCDMRIEDVRGMLSILFQLPVSYDASAGQNIAIGHLASQPTAEAIEAAARSAGAHETISRLPRGYDTLLGKSFENGTDLSAGEWQRVAMARAFLRRSPIILLDEPTSFMDSWAEVEWFDKLRELAIGRTAMVVTHRFTIAMRADLIYVMDGGKVVESGSHQSLLRTGGLYAESWREQMLAGSARQEEPEIGERDGVSTVLARGTF
jgi:ATP-binding cassette subfamily B protein